MGRHRKYRENWDRNHNQIQAKRGRPPKYDRPPVKGFDINQETKNSIWGIISISLAILSALSFMGQAGRAGELFDNVSRSLFGWGFFIIPLAFLFLGFSFI